MGIGRSGETACQVNRETCGSVICDNYLEIISNIKLSISEIEKKIDSVFGSRPTATNEGIKSSDKPVPVIQVENGLGNILERIQTISGRLNNEL